MKRVVITGMGVVSPLGCDLAVVAKCLYSGSSGIRKITRFDVTNYASQIAGEVVDFNADTFYAL